MNKKFLTLIFMFVIMCFISVVDVRALTTCNYGVREKDGAEWHQMVQVAFDGSTGVLIYPDESKIFEKIKTSNGFFDLEPAGKSILEYNTRLDNGVASDVEDGDRYYFYAQVFANSGGYNELNGACPPSLYYEIVTMYDKYTYYHIKIAPDDMIARDDKIMGTFEHNGSDNECDDSDNCAAEKVATSLGFYSVTGTLIEENYRDQDLVEFADAYGCQTYSLYYQAMVDAVENDDEKSCDNNVAFTEKYQQIQNLCAAYRSTGEYYTILGVSNCQKACSVLKDDVATLCGTTPDPGECGIGDRVLNWIFRIFGIVRYAVPALLIILSVLDYIKAIAADNEDEMKKVTSRFFIRLIAAALIFLLPLILDFILKMFDIPGLDSRNPFCAE